jgi:hypothetical protein
LFTQQRNSIPALQKQRNIIKLGCEIFAELCGEKRKKAMARTL